MLTNLSSVLFETIVLHLQTYFFVLDLCAWRCKRKVSCTRFGKLLQSSHILVLVQRIYKLDTVPYQGVAILTCKLISSNLLIDVCSLLVIVVHVTNIGGLAGDCGACYGERFGQVARTDSCKMDQYGSTRINTDQQSVSTISFNVPTLNSNSDQQSVSNQGNYVVHAVTQRSMHAMSDFMTCMHACYV
ncbi:unnamed protein product [Albugo candida]|uniref:Uncharacterized protein n=1 Tax=Albugo candida TaxID=65357 RepID=A0A024GW20_9STRA|nr:unnamed protein product [Albugo candida]|eukprot:CCI50906.1 unnamed protein product [Albugo candida]